MNAPANIVVRSDPDTIAFAEALARAHVARDIAAAKDRIRVNPDLRQVQ